MSGVVIQLKELTKKYDNQLERVFLELTGRQLRDYIAGGRTPCLES